MLAKTTVQHELFTLVGCKLLFSYLITSSVGKSVQE